MERPDNPYAPPVAAVPFALPGVPGQVDLATRSSRLGAAMLDGLAGFVAILPGFLVFFLMSPSGGGDPSGLAMGLGFGLMGVGLIGLVVANLYLLAQRAQSVGKLALGIRIALLDGRQADFRTIAVKRMLPVALMGMVPFLGSVVSIVDTLMIFRPDQRCLHDLIAGTVVVRA